jgi:hypothetical protein
MNVESSRQVCRCTSRDNGRELIQQLKNEFELELEEEREKFRFQLEKERENIRLQVEEERIKLRILTLTETKSKKTYSIYMKLGAFIPFHLSQNQSESLTTPCETNLESLPKMVKLHLKGIAIYYYMGIYEGEKI